MRYIPAEARVVWSASDLKAAAECEFAWLRGIDARIGRITAVEEPEDATLERAGRLGGEHELRVLAGYRATYGDGVVEIAETSSANAEGLAEAVARTREALASDADVIYQAAFATHEFVGFADFLVRDEVGRWIVQDSKLARRARVTALMQLSAYVDQLDRLGVARSDRVELLLGDGTVSVHIADELLPVFALRRARLRALIDDRRLDLGLGWPAIAWGDPRGDLGVVACGRCATCDSEVVAARDLLLVAGMRPVQRDRLRTSGITTIDQLAYAPTAPSRMNPDTFGMLRTQSRLQLSAPAGTGAAVALHESHPAMPPFEVVAPKALGALPRPDAGDLFFDFEGDPLYTEGDATVWGIDYLFGWVDIREQYSAIWAHSFDEERAALEAFLDFVQVHRSRHPDFHIYHYAPYEPTHLLTMAARHGTREADVDRLLRDGVFVDLYPIVRRSLRIGSRSYSIKKLEPLYMGDEVRTSDVQKGDESIVKYVEARALRDDGDTATAQEIFADLADYNRYDCVSTRRLRDWLVDRARDAGLRPLPNPEPGENVYEPSARALALSALALQHPEDSAEAMALRLGAAGIDYYAREAKSFWATHYLRLREPVSLWEETRDVVSLDSTRCCLVEDWHRPEGARADRRILELRGELAPGTRLSEGSNPFALYELPAPYPFEPSPRWIHSDHRVTVIEVLDDGAIVEENAVSDVTWTQLPVALTPSPPPRALNQQVAIDAWADAVIAASPELPADPATDILRRRAPRTHRQAQRPDQGLPASTGDDVDAIVRAVVDLDRSYLAVQGPPGTGKTYVGSHVIARLVRERGFKVGVVAQSHAVIENMLCRIVDAGVQRERVAKAPKDPTADDLAFTPITKNGVPEFTAAHAEAGYVIGGTAWDFAHEGRIPRGSLDLLVIDEAGQFSLASTIAVSLAASRLLLLGDPQQLPQVSQGTHPEPVDTSALGWVMDGADVIPPEYGYFLARTWRMHPQVAAPVSRLSYSGELAAHPATALRELTGVAPGLIPVPVRHRGNATQSLEEARVVVDIVRDLVGREWTGIEIADGGHASRLAPRPLEETDIIVVTPYNAQQVAVEEALAEAGFRGVPVGTVDRFQGQEAAVAIVSLAASSGRDAPRGLEFL
ncbi:MAG TPA: TM0106 family RecB-like putative nuclease, partial [Microbacterium sp.]|nr:TM0106 family RecB-like putative nuclease [Microbacterium sp.]